MSDLISKKELYHKLGEAYKKGHLSWGANEIIKDIIGECDSVEIKGDLISRQAVLNALKEHRALYCDNTPETFSKLSYAEKSRVDELDTAIATIINLPSVENKGEDRPKGHWIYWSNSPFRWECDKCGGLFKTDFNFCPNCGADMRGKSGNDEKDFPQAEDIEPTVKSFSKVLGNKLVRDAIRDCEQI